MKMEKVYRKDLKAWRWGFDVTISGQRIRRYEWPKKKDAQDALAALYDRDRRIRYGMEIPRPQITLQELWEKTEKDKELKARTHTFRVFKEFMALIEPTTELCKLTIAHWGSYVETLKDRECRPNTINKYLAEVSTVLNSAPKRFPDLGDWRAPKAPWLREAAGRNRLLSKEEIAKLLMALRSERQLREKRRGVANRLEIFDLFRLMLLIGAREGEILNLKQSQVSWDWRTVNVIATKTKTTRVVPLSDTAFAILQARKIHAPRFFPVISPDSLYDNLRKIAEMTKIPYGERVEGGWVLYDLRHVAATVMENAGVPYSAVSAILGHKRKDQTATYAHAQLDTLRKAVEVLESHCREIDGFGLENDGKNLDRLIGRQQASG
jgi:integrase